MAAITRGRGDRVRQETTATVTRGTGSRVSQETTGGSSTLNISATCDGLTLAEYAATVGKSLNISATSDALTLAEYAATVGLSHDVSASLETLTLTEYAATLGATHNVDTVTDALTLAELAASIGLSLNISASVESLLLAEYAATISAVGEQIAIIGGGVSKKYPRRVLVNGQLVLVRNAAEERRLLAAMAERASEQAKIAEALGDSVVAEIAQRKAFKLTKRVKATDDREAQWLQLLRNEDEEILTILLH